MKHATAAVLALAGLVGNPNGVAAFPTSIGDGLPSTAGRGLLDPLAAIGEQAVGELTSVTAPVAAVFSADQQHIDVDGLHAWQAPGPGDARGPCPGLNALANHGYLPRTGLATVADFVTATTTVFGMGADLAAILAAYGAVLDGVAVGWSIGGQPHTGIGGSHNNYESDNSPMRGDLNQYGSNVDLVVSQFQELYAMQPDPTTANYDIDVLSAFRKNRFQESVAKNPYFFYGPFTGTAVTQAAFFFIYRFMANHTAEQPDGVLDQDVLKSFFAMSGSGSNLTWTPGYERIPDNWYRRSLNSSYGLDGLATDISAISKQAPYLGQPGCNMGEVNTFTPINTANTSASAYNFNNPIDSFCYGIAQAVAVGNNVPVVNGVVQEILLPIQNTLGCVTAPAANESVGQACPGYSSYGGPTGTVAPGAIQN